MLKLAYYNQEDIGTLHTFTFFKIYIKFWLPTKRSWLRNW